MSFQTEIDKAIKEKRLYFIGDALPPDWYAAFRQWLPLAEAGDPKAQFNIGRCYSRGDGVEQDQGLAENWYLRAADQDDPRAHFNLYLMYSDEKNEKYKKDKAATYFNLAIDFKESRALALSAVENEKIEDQKNAEYIESQVYELSKIVKIHDAVVKNFLAENNRVGLNKYLDSLQDSRFEYLKKIDAYFDLEIIDVNKEDFSETTYTEAGILRGTTQYIKDTKRWSIYTFKIRNNSSETLTLYPESKPEIVIKPGEIAELKQYNKPQLQNFTYKQKAFVHIDEVRKGGHKIFEEKRIKFAGSIPAKWYGVGHFKLHEERFYFNASEDWIIPTAKFKKPREDVGFNALFNTLVFVFFSVVVVMVFK